MSVNVKDHGEGVISVCDSNLLGKTLEDGNISFKVSEYFYKGDEMSAKDAGKYMLAARHLNLLGEKSIDEAKRLKLVEESGIMLIAGVPHAQVYTIEQ